MDRKIALFAIIFCFTIFTLLYVFRIFNTQFSKRKGREILKLYNNEKLKSLEVKISETRYSRFLNSGGTLGFLDATMHYSENIIIFTQSENSSVEKLNFTLPLVVDLKTIKNIYIKSDEYILDIGNSDLRKKIQIFSEIENDLLKVIFNNYKTNMLKI